MNLRRSSLRLALLVAGLVSFRASAATYEAESLPRTATGAGATVIVDSSASAGNWLRFDADSLADYIDLTVPSVPAGTYNVKFTYKSHDTARGQLQVAINGTNQGGTVNQSIAPNNQFRTVDLGTKAFASSGNATFRFTTTAAGTNGGLTLSIDTLRLEPTDRAWEAESLSYTASGATTSLISDSAGSGGQWVRLDSNSVGDAIDFTLPNVLAGTYAVSYDYKSHDTARGVAQASFGGADLGLPINQSLLPKNEYRTAFLGTKTFATTGNQTLRLTTSAIGNSGGYGLSIDRIKLHAPFFSILPNPVLTGYIHLPSLLVTENDTVLLLAQKRIQPGDKDASDVTFTRSTDGGVTWSTPVNLFTSNGTTDTGYSCMLVEDRTTTPNTLLAFYTVGPVNWPSAASLVWYGRTSTDEGATWSAPFLVGNDGAASSKPSNGGHGFQFANGRLVIPGRGNLLYSDDGGATWTTSGTAESVETKVVGLVDSAGTELDQAYLITRTSTTYRIYEDFGQTLVEQGNHGNTYTTNGRNPGLARYSNKLTGPTNLLLMAGIDNSTNRDTSITYSTDEGRTWSARKLIDTDGWYSEIGVLSDGTIIVAYTINFSDDLRIARFNLPWLMSN